jgi:TRAP transporter TAXI family solute receptor
MSISISALRGLVALFCLFIVVPLSPSSGQAQQAQRVQPTVKAAISYEEKKRQLSDIAVTIVTSGITCTCARFAEDIRDIVNDLRPDGLRVLPVLGVGGLQTLEDVLFLKGIDMGVVDEDNLRLLKKRDPQLYANIEQRVHYITRLYNNEFHVVARNEINSFDDLRGKKVSFNLKNSQTEVTADAIFTMLNLDVERLNYDNNEAIKKLREGEIAAMIVVSGAPQAALAKLKKEDGVHFLALDEQSLPGHDLGPVFDNYLLANLTHDQYPALIEEGASVPTVANRALLVAYNWPQNSPRYVRLTKFVETFFDRIYQFHDNARHPKWKEINLAAEVQGWTRFKPAADWLTRHRGALASREGQPLASLRPAFEQFAASYTASRGNKPLSPQETEALFVEFRKFLESQVTAKSTR